MKSPFPWFGAKSRAAHLVWERFGDVPNYVEPFFGSGAVLLGRPWLAKTETINDLDCMVANFWRALQHAPDAVAHHADWPVNECDLEARHRWLVNNAEFKERMKHDPEHFDVKVAGWWVWGICSWIGSGWCSGKSSWGGEFSDGELSHPRLPRLGDAGVGVHRKLACLSGGGLGIDSQRGADLLGYMNQLAARLRKVRVCCGDWSRVLGPSVTFKHGITGVFLDPPYADTAGREPNIYAEDSLDVAYKAREWAIANGDNRDLRIALCGYDGEHEMPGDWECVAWKAQGGYASQGEGNENKHRERIWFSPHCLKPQQGLFSEFKELAMRYADDAADEFAATLESEV
jgi:site-specific DNA-adenine methylase